MEPKTITTKLYIDCEFNGFGGELISMALFAEHDLYFYEVLECDEPDGWVAEHVMPFLNKHPIDKEIFKAKLQSFLGGFEHVEIIADWPEDIIHFCSKLLTGPGMMLQTMPVITMTIDRNLGSGNSRIPHNALEDARAIREMAL